MDVERKITVLVVDDSDLIRNSLKNFFKEYDFEVITCSDGLEGIQKTIEYKPDLIMLDLMMPNFDGVKMLQVIKVMDNIKDTPVFIISGNTNRSNVLAAIEAGADHILTKPLQKEILIKHLREVLGNDVLSRSMKKSLSDKDNKEIVKQMQRLFINSFPVKKSALEKALEKRDKDLMRTIVHQLKGEGGTIGAPNLTKVCSELEQKLTEDEIDWTYSSLKTEEVFLIVSKLKKSFVTTVG